MAIPSRNSIALNTIQFKVPVHTFFVTTSCWQNQNVLQSDRMASLLADSILHYRTEQKFQLHDFVIMPNHLHVLISLDSMVTVEKSAQFIKGGFSFRAKRELGYQWPIWQKGFSEIRILSSEEYYTCSNYIHQNPVRAGLVLSGREWQYSSASGKFDLDPCPEFLRG